LDLPLDEFGAVDFDYVQNLAGKHAYIAVDFFHYMIMNLTIEWCNKGNCQGDTPS
jgi:hypothetical protein